MIRSPYYQKLDKANPCVSTRFKKAQLKKIDKYLETIKLTRSEWLRKIALRELGRQERREKDAESYRLDREQRKEWRSMKWENIIDD